MKKPTAIDLFCGCGGLTQGLKDAGFRVAGAVDINPLAVKSYKSNHKRLKVWETDICQLKVAEVKRHLKLRKGQLDLLAGCPPCQGFSSMRTLNKSHAVKDARNDLIFEFLRFVEELMPKAVMLENVPGLRSDRRFRRFCKRLRELGYDDKFDVLNTADYGVPQRRRRLILLATRYGTVDFAPKDARRRTVSQAIRYLPSPKDSKDVLHHSTEKRSERIKQLITTY